MKILLTGATGMIGRALVLRLRREGHTLVAWVRDADRARSLLGQEVELWLDDGEGGSLVDLVSRVDGIVNLAGEPVAGGRWTERRRRSLVASRVSTTERLVAAMAEATPRPSVLVSGSAVGIYGDRGDADVDETSPPGSDFLAELCVAWEKAAFAATAHGVRVVALRIGVVLGRDGGALDKMLPLFRVGLGGVLGTGRQFMPWVHLHDVVEVAARSLADPRYRGPLDVTAPEPVSNRDFTRALGRALGRPTVMKVPAFALRAAMGSAASIVLGGQRARPRALARLGYAHLHRELGAALEDVLASDEVDIGPLARGDGPTLDDGSGYLAARRPRYLLSARTSLDAPIERVFAFFSRPENLGLMTPAAMRFRIRSLPDELRAGAVVEYALAVGPLPLRWRTRIAAFEPSSRFVDAQERGPYRAWWHEHGFARAGRHTVMEDRVYYAPPLGWLGRIANRLFVVPQLRRIFGFRRDAIRLRFGAA